jgi:SAM-dependent methyltransferase
MSLQVSVIIPAYNGAQTIARTLQSLREQTFSDWEAIVVNDGSTDDTITVVEDLKQQEPRIRLINQTNQGLSGARNTGVINADYDWLLFLDADDWIYPQHLEKLTQKLKNDPSLDVVYCGWAYVTPNGEVVSTNFPSLTGDLFVPFTQYCVSVVHTFLVPKYLVENLGKFDHSLRSCEDWALWQRIARTGVRFGAVEEILAAYRMSPYSMSRNGKQLLLAGCEVLRRGHAPDPEISHPVYPQGMPPKRLVANEFDLLYACAGYLIGGGKDARELLELIPATPIQLNPYIAANCILTHALVTTAISRQEWYHVWPSFQENLKSFLLALEKHSGTPDFAHKTYWFAEKLIGQRAQDRLMSRRIRTCLANLELFINHQLPMNWHLAKQKIKHLLWVALLLLPQVKIQLQTIKRAIFPDSNTENYAVNPESHFETLFANDAVPWNYENIYEKTKYQQTLAVLPDVPIESALELACAAGDFTYLLAPRVQKLLAADISLTALEKTRKLCQKYSHVAYDKLDYSHEEIPGKFDLIVCSEALFYLSGQPQLQQVSQKFIKALKTGGYLLMCHSNCIEDDWENPGFDWGHAFGGKVIGETFGKSPQLQYIKEVQTPLYRIQLWQKRQFPQWFNHSPKPQTVELVDYVDLPARTAESLIWQTTTQLPILVYDRITTEVTDNSVTPEILADHLQYLQNQGYESTTFQQWEKLVNHHRFLPGKKVILVFANGEENFLNYAWPLLEKYGFSATLCLYADEIGKLVTHEPLTDEEISLIPWKKIRQLQGKGLNFASRGLSRRPDNQTISSLKQSYQIFQNELAMPINTYVYPRDKSNMVWQYLAGISGYEYGIILDQSRRGKMTDSLLALPSFHIKNDHSLPIIDK